MPKIFETFSAQVEDMRGQLQLLPRVDLISSHNLFFLLAGEAEELEEAFSTEPHTIKEWAMEYHDTIVFLVSLALTIGKLDSILQNPRIYSSNGEANASNFFDQLTIVIFEGQDDPRAFVEVFRLLHSFAHHTTISPDQLFTYMEPTIAKVLANRPVEFFQPRDPQTGKQLTDEGDIMTVYLHLEVMFRLIRKHVGRTLEKSDWQLHRDLIALWQDSPTAQEALKQRLQSQPKPGDLVIEEGVWFSPQVLPSGILVAISGPIQSSQR